MKAPKNDGLRDAVALPLKATEGEASVPVKPVAAADASAVREQAAKRYALGSVQLKRAPSGLPSSYTGGALWYVHEPFPHVLIGATRYPLAEVAWFRFPLDLARA